MHLLASVCVLILICGGGCWGGSTGCLRVGHLKPVQKCIFPRDSRVFSSSRPFSASVRSILRSVFPDSLRLTYVLGVNRPCFTGLCSEDEERLVRDLFRGYNKLIRPVQNMTEKVHVNFGLAFVQLINVVSGFLAFHSRL